MSSFSVLIAGHSHAKYFGKYLSLPDTDVLSFSGYRIDMMFKEMQPTVRNYQTIVLHVGANDLSRGTTVKNTLQKLQQITSDIWDINPTATILLSGLLPRADNQFPGAMPRHDFLQDLNNRAYQVNNCLASLQTQIPKLHYVSHSSLIQHGEIQRHLLSRDGLHLSFKGTAQVVANIEKAVLDLHNTEPTSIWDIQLPTPTPATTQTQQPTPYKTALLTLPTTNTNTNTSTSNYSNTTTHALQDGTTHTTNSTTTTNFRAISCRRVARSSRDKYYPIFSFLHSLSSSLCSYFCSHSCSCSHLCSYSCSHFCFYHDI